MYFLNVMTYHGSHVQVLLCRFFARCRHTPGTQDAEKAQISLSYFIKMRKYDMQNVIWPRGFRTRSSGALAHVTQQ